MKGRKWNFVFSRRYSAVVGLALATIAAALALSGCTKTEPTQEPAAPPPAPAPAAVEIGMNVGERYHDVHAKLQLECNYCHTNTTQTYYDPLAQVSNLADKRACLSCHKEGSAQPFYGEDWIKANVKQ